MADVIVPTGKGLEKLITATTVALQKIENGIVNVAYGNPDKDGGIKFPGRATKTNGLLPIFREINAIDFCNIISYSLGQVQLVRQEVREGQEEANSIEKKILKVRDVAKKALDFLDGDYLNNTKFDDAKIKELTGYLAEVNNLIDTDILTLFPKLLQTKNQIFDVIGILTQISAAQSTYENFNQIPNAEIQKLLTEIRKAREILSFIASLPSLGSIVDRLIPEQVKELQRILNPAQLLPYIRKGLNLARAADNICQEALQYVNTARIISKVLVILVKVLKIIIKFYRALPLPNTTTTHGITDTLIAARQKVDKKLDDAEKRAKQLNQLINVIYGTLITIAGAVREVVNQIQILILNLETCEDTKNSPMVNELVLVNGSLRASLARIDKITQSYLDAQANANQATYNGYTFKIDEEELTDKGVKYKRRRAVAYDDRDILVEATQLTFATDVSILFEELKLLLINKGVTKDTGTVVPTVADITSILSLPETDQDIYTSIGMNEIDGVLPDQQMSEENKAVLQAVSAFVDGLPGGTKLKQRARQGIDANSVKLKSDIKEKKIDPTVGNQVTGGLTSSTGNITSTINSAVETTSSTTSTASSAVTTTNPDLLTPEEKQRYIDIIKTRPPGSAEFIEAVEKLEKDRKARGG